MNAALDRLQRIYRQQLEIYDEVLALADLTVTAARKGESLQELNVLLDRKRARLDEVEGLDALVQPDRRAWQVAGRSAGDAGRLRELIAQLSLRIDQILAREREMEHWLLLRGEDATPELDAREEGA